MKKIYSIMAAMCVCISMQTQEFNTTKIETETGEGYEISAKDGVAYTGDLVIPDSLPNTEMTGPKKLPVIQIGGNAFANSAITGLEIPKTVQVIDRSAFWNCQQLRRVYIYAQHSKLQINLNGFAFGNDFAALYVHKDSVGVFEDYSTYFQGGIFPLEEGAVSMNMTTATKENYCIDLVWFLKTGVTKYVVNIYEEGEPKWTRTFDGNGNETGISAEGMPARSLETSTTMGVGVASIGPLGNKKKYNYEIKGTDAESKEIMTKRGSFSLDMDGMKPSLEQSHNEALTPSGTEETSAGAEKAGKVLKDGAVYIEKDGKLLNMQGQEVRR